MSEVAVDWNAAWKQAKKDRPRKKDASFWDKRASSFSKHVRESDYEKSFLALLRPKPAWTVLDVGCGSGTLAVPLAEQISRVTALDFSPAMLELLGKRCLESGLCNVDIVQGRWEDDWEKLGIGSYDVVIASRSLVVDDLADALGKLNRAARKQVYVVAMVGDGPYDRRIFEAIGRPLKRGPDYIYVYNFLHQTGICADISFITLTDWKEYADVDEAVEGMRWMLNALSDEEEARLRAYLAEALEPHQGGWRLPAPKVVRWAVISWQKEE